MSSKPYSFLLGCMSLFLASSAWAQAATTPEGYWFSYSLTKGTVKECDLKNANKSVPTTCINPIIIHILGDRFYKCNIATGTIPDDIGPKTILYKPLALTSSPDSVFSYAYNNGQISVSFNGETRTMQYDTAKDRIVDGQMILKRAPDQTVFSGCP